MSCGRRARKRHWYARDLPSPPYSPNASAPAFPLDCCVPPETCRPNHTTPPAFSTQLAERAELWWDDGTAEPEWFVDRGSSGGADGGRPWAVSNEEAVMQLSGFLLFLGTFIGGAAYLMGEALRPAAKRWEYGYPVDMRAQFGLPTASGEDEDE